MRMELKGKTALVTGASSGIGRSTALALARAGARVAIAARRTPALEKLAGEIAAAGAPPAVVLTADLSKRGEALGLARRAVEALGHVDILVNNAGIGIGGSQWNVGDADIAREMMETNYWSPLALTAALVPAMRSRRTGAVVNVSSLAGDVPFTMMGHYASTKAALSLASEALRAELHGSGINILLVLPGPVDTGMLAEAREVGSAARLMKRMPRGNPDQLARLIVRGIARGRGTLCYPRLLAIGHVLPGLARRVSFRMMRGGTDPDDDRVLKGGSTGDEIARAAREKFESQAGAAAPAEGAGHRETKVSPSVN